MELKGVSKFKQVDIESEFLELLVKHGATDGNCLEQNKGCEGEGCTLEPSPAAKSGFAVAGILARLWGGVGMAH